MSTYRQLQIALGTILLLSSTSVSSFAATNTITPGKFQSDTVKLPVASIPSRQLNLTPDTNLIADLPQFRTEEYFYQQFINIWKDKENRLDSARRLRPICPSQQIHSRVEEEMVGEYNTLICWSVYIRWIREAQMSNPSPEEAEYLEALLNDGVENRNNMVQNMR